MKKCALIAILVLLLLPGSGVASGIPTFPFVFVSGQAEKEVPPDVATVSFNVQAFDKDPAKALSVVRERSSQLMAIFNKYGIDKKDVVAFEINKETVRETKNYVALRILGYEITRQINITVRKLDGFDALMTQMMSLRNISHLRTAFDTTQRKDIEAELFGQAAQKAREQAELLAKGFGSEIASVHAISVSPFPVIEEVFGVGSAYGMHFSTLEEKSVKREAVMVLVPSTVNLLKAVNAIYKLRSGTGGQSLTGDGTD
jgi:uncharacterized protein